MQNAAWIALWMGFIVSQIGAWVNHCTVKRLTRQLADAQDALQRATNATMQRHTSRAAASRKGWETRRARRLGERLPIEANKQQEGGQ